MQMRPAIPVFLCANDVIRDLTKNAIRAKPLIPFHIKEVYAPFRSEVKEDIGAQAISVDEYRKILEAACRCIESECPGLRVGINRNLYGITLSMLGDTEWNVALSYAHGINSRSEAERALSPSAAELLERVESGELGEFRTETSVRHRIRFFGYSSCFVEIINEIRLKHGVEIAIEEKGEQWIQRKHLLKFAVVSRNDPSVPPKGHNPVLPGGTGALLGPREFRRWFYQMIVDAPFSGRDPVHIWSIRSRAEFFRCFPQFRSSGQIDSDQLAALLAGVHISSIYEMGWGLEGETYDWTVVVGPNSTWDELRDALRKELSKPTTESQYGLCAAAATLFEWGTALYPKKLEMGLTPEIEEAIRERHLQLDCPWPEENFRLYLNLLCEEITERTLFDFRPVDWLLHGSAHARIRIKPTTAISQ